ncbi:hypothetical protein [Massilia sp. CT11-137]|uniref:hypothetical protein n=1 Tax=Massilia sp. CT11-137 TaxID=3393901 RepID=UPI0039B09657
MTALERLLIAAVLAVLLAVGTWFGIHHYGAERYDAGHAAAMKERAALDAVAVLKRTTENAATAAAQAHTNSIITKAKNEELAPVRERIVTQRVYVGSAICDGPPAPAQTADAASGDGANPPGRLVRPDVDRDIKALKLAVEEDLATGRSCQEWGKKNGFLP